MEAVTTITSMAIILGATWLPSFGFIENALVRLLIIAGIVYASIQGPVPGILAFLAAFTLLIERNHEVLTKFPNQRPRFPTANYGFPGISTASIPIQSMESIPYAPINENKNIFVSKEENNTAKGLHDNNPRLPSAPPSKDAMNFYKSKGLL